MYRQSLTGLGCDCSGMGVVRSAAMFESSAPVNGLHGLGDFGDYSTNDSGDAINTLADYNPVLDTLANLNTLAPGGTYSWGSNVPLGAKNTSTGQPVTAAQVAKLIAQAAAGASAVYKSIQGPYVVPGTNVVYNPATGQYASASGVALQGGTLNLGGLLPLLLIGGLVLVMSGGRGR